MLCSNKTAITTLLSSFFNAICSFVYIFDTFFSCFVFLLYSDIYFEYNQAYKKEGSQITQRLYSQKLL